MKHISTTPFGRRPVAAGHLAHVGLADAPCPAMPLDKWAVIRDLTAARRAFEISDRDLHVLHALLTFLPSPVLSADAPTIVFPSNTRLSERLHGMPESTLRRHIAALVTAGLILRHDSPNGKRFARRDTTGGLRAFGFDLRPLLVRCHEISTAAEQARNDAQELRELRETAILHLRDVMQLMPDNPFVPAIQKALRRKLDIDAMRALVIQTAALAETARSELPSKTPVSSADDTQNERHIQDSNRTLYESESYSEEEMSLSDVLSACPASFDYALTPIKNWNSLIETAQRLYPMLGIGPEVWHQARRSMGAIEAATTVVCILQRFERIASPGAYLRSLAKKATTKSYTSMPMVRALLATHS